MCMCEYSEVSRVANSGLSRVIYRPIRTGVTSIDIKGRRSRTHNFFRHQIMTLWPAREQGFTERRREEGGSQFGRNFCVKKSRDFDITATFTQASEQVE